MGLKVLKRRDAEIAEDALATYFFASFLRRWTWLTLGSPTIDVLSQIRVEPPRTACFFLKRRYHSTFVCFFSVSSFHCLG